VPPAPKPSRTDLVVFFYGPDGIKLELLRRPG
jgi:hypothetical protein